MMGTGLLTRTEKSVLFVIPWGEHWLIGDTDTEWPYDPASPAASRADIDYLLAKANRMLASPLTPRTSRAFSRACGRWSPRPRSGDTTRLSREHTIDSSVPGLSVIAGGKYTTYRVMARDLIDAAARDLAAGPGPGRPSRRPGPSRCRWPARPATRPGGRAGSGSRRTAGCRSARWSGCSAGTARTSTTCWR